MARKYAYHCQNLVTMSEDNVNRELFGSGVVKEIHKAEKVLQDFASYTEYPEYDELRRNLSSIIAELHACTQCGQPSQIMPRVRQQYM